MNSAGPKRTRPRTSARLPRDQRRQQILTIAAEQFTATGFRSTTCIHLAKAAGVSEAVLYIHFGTKQKLFEAVVQRNADRRLKELQARFSSIPNVSPVECVEKMAEAAILACSEGESTAALMAWALMELPEYAADVYRSEIGSTEAMWNAEIARRFAGSLAGTRLIVHLVPYAVHACMSFGFWLAALRHRPPTAAAHARQYAGGLADAARTVLGFPAESSASDEYAVRPEPALVG